MSVGANGEEQALGFFIQEFLRLNVNNRIEALNSVYKLMESRLGSNKQVLERHKQFMGKCIEVFDRDEKLKKALIPFFYITMHYKYANFDLVAYRNKQAVLVEVKSTQSRRKGPRDNFKISRSEVETALGNANYEIVRVSPERLELLGNPIKAIKDKLTKVEGGNFTIIPDGYTFEFYQE